MDSVNVWNMDVSEGMAIMASNYSIIYKGSQWAMHKGTPVAVYDYNRFPCVRKTLISLFTREITQDFKKMIYAIS